MKAVKAVKGQQGFTMIELIMVIVILGVLAAFALPRFADLGADARRATLNGAMASVRSASAIAHSAFLAAGTSPATVSLEGTTINIVNGYPAVGDIDNAAQLEAADFTATVVGTTVTFSPAGVTTVASCSFTYTEAGAGGSPAITLVSDSDCS